MARRKVSTYTLESWNPRTKKWQSQGTATNITDARKKAKYWVKALKRRIKIVKEELITIYDKNGKVEK